MKTPATISTYFSQRSSELFTEDALVHDEAHDHRGRAEIAEWIDDTQRRYQFKNELLRAERDGDDWLATARVTGKFPGSPIELRYRFTLKGALIAKLGIA